MKIFFKKKTRFFQADIDLAVKAAKKAFERGSVYRNLDASARGKLLWK